MWIIETIMSWLLLVCDIVAWFLNSSLLNLLQLLDAVSHMASLGFEKSYRETVVLMTRSYLSKLSIVGSAESKTMAAEATTERVEVCLPLRYRTYLIL